MLLSIYNILNHQINKSDNKNIHAAFINNVNEDELHLLDSTVQSISAIHKISNIMPDNDWIFIYDGDEATLIISTFQGQNEALWIALSMGVLIASIILIGTYVIYYYIVKRKKDE
jgi:putative methionine-R-sulfoxide reductase with GAF domain